MTYAPDDLKAVQRYAQAKTGQDWASLGITHQTPQGGGYHEGHDLLHAAGTAPEDPGSDYSYTESQRDRNGLTDAASAFDFGNGFPRFYEFNAWVVNKARAGDPRCRDIREIIHTLDGQTVRRWDALGVRSNGDSSHLTHTHFSFFRDSEGRRAQADNFLGLLQEFFDGATPTPEVPDMTPDESRLNANSEHLLTQWGAGADTVTVDYGGGNKPTLPNPFKKLKTELLAAMLNQPAQAAVALTDAQLQTVIDGVTAKLTALIPTAAQIAAANADEEAKRLSNG